MKKVYSILSILLTIALIGTLVSCEKDQEVMLTAVSVTNEQITPMYNSATISSTISSEATIREVFVQYARTKDFAEYDEVSMQKIDGRYTAELLDLQDNTIYYYRYAASNRHSAIVLKTIHQFETLKPTVPTISLDTILTVWDSYAQVQITLSFDGGATISEMGVCWGTNPEPTPENYAVQTSDSVAMLKIDSLESNTQYYVRAYAKNKIGVGYSQTYTFTTFAMPQVQSNDITDVQLTSAMLNGLLLSDGNDTAVVVGFCWSENEEPTISDTLQIVEIKDNIFSYYLSSLKDETQYFVRAFAQNRIGVAYGEVKAFTTASTVIPTVLTTAATQVTTNSAVVGGNVTDDGGAEVTERGIVYATTPNPTTANSKLTSGSGVGEFTCDLTDLQSNATYYARAYAINKKGVAYGEEVSFTTKNIVSDPTGTENGYGYVDLGLSVKWATCNVGANSPEEYGDYFAWGEVEPKSIYDWSTYKYCNGSETTLTKYCTNSSYGTVDNKTTLELSDDAARANWGGSWRMPTYAEMTELREQCTWTWTSQNGVYGYNVTSKKNGNSIFLPAAGCRYDSSLGYAGSRGLYWSSSLKTDTPYRAYEWYFFSDVVYRYDHHRYQGQSVRPVLDESEEEVTDPTVTTAAITQITETSAVAGGNVTSDGNASVTERGVVYSTNPNPVITNLYNTIKPSGSGTGSFTCDLTNLQPNTTYYVRAYATNEKGTAYGEEVSFTTNKNIVLPSLITNIITQITETTAVAGGNVTSDGNASVTERGVVYSTNPNPVITNLYNTIKPCGSGTGSFTCDLTNLQPNTTYYLRAYATNSMGTAYGEEVSFTTEEEAVVSDPTGTENGYGYVDLGLSVKWATYNVGATSPEEYGSYFAWGETTTKSIYNSNTYKYFDASSLITKYNTKHGEGNVDNKTTLDLSDDAAHANWGGNWRMPTDAELTELREQCTWKWAAQNGLYGYKVTSKKNGNSIFLRAAGYRIEGSHEGATNNGFYWSSSLDTDYTSRAWGLHFGSSGLFWINSGRYGGYSVRPVLGESVVETTIPTVTTTIPTQITETTAVAGGNVTSDGNASVTERGIVYSTNTNPVITNLYNTIKPCGSGTGSFTCDLTNLQPNTTYYVRAYATNSIGMAYGEEISFTTQEQVSPPFDDTENGYGYVDLGLSVKWATCNVGANTPEEYGDYFAWGETEPKETYDDDNYKWFTSGLGYTKYYNGTVGTGILDNRKTMEPSDDAATVNWGGNWRVPTREELTELETNCTWTLTTQSGISGYRVTSKKAGYTNKSIFIPLAGKRGGYYKEHVGELALYWSSSLYLYECSSAFVLYNDECINTDMNRYTGLTIRPVYGPRVEEVTALPTVITHAVTALESDYALIMYEILDDGGSNITDAGVVYSLSTNPTILDNKVSFEKHPNDKFECDLYDLQPNTTYYVRAYATNEMGTAYGEEISFTTKEESNTPSNGTENGYAYVDLGLSVKWATMNVGASSPEEYGDYFAWGETQPKSTYNWSTYKHCNNSKYVLKKYNTFGDYGVVDNKTILELSDDAAHVNMGGEWRMPTETEWAELREQCTWTWSTQDGINGYKVISNINGNSIFFPTAGCSNNIDVGIAGYYWSIELYTTYYQTYNAYYYHLSSSQSVGVNHDERYKGMSIRAVCP